MVLAVLVKVLGVGGSGGWLEVCFGVGVCVCPFGGHAVEGLLW